MHNRKEYSKILLLRTIGNFLVLSSLFFIAKTFLPVLRAETSFLVNSYFKKTYVVTTDVKKEEDIVKKVDNRGLLAKALTGKQIELLKPVDASFSVVIPKVGANSKIIANVDPSNEREYLEDLQQGVAHTLGTSFPGENGHIYLFAHSTDYFWNVGAYNAVFYLLYKLEKGDEVDLFYKGHRYTYSVIGRQIIDPSQVEYLTRKTDKEFLTLQTCWPPGTTLQRLLVFATPVADKTGK